MQKTVLFEQMKIKNMAVRNRFVRSATFDRCADEFGHVSDRQIKLYEELAEGGVGLIITGLVSVTDYYGQITPFRYTLAGDDYIPGYKRLTAAVHDRGAKIAIQIYHPGREGARFIEGQDRLAMAPSLVDNDLFFADKHRAMTEDEIWKAIQEFGDAAKRAREADFDAVQLHGAHAYLLSQFLSPHTNRRGDRWGGALENRLHFHREIFRNIRSKVGEDYPVLIKLGVQDGFPGGLEFAEGKAAARLLAEWGYDALEISQGLRGTSYEGTEFRVGINTLEKEGYFRDWCKEIKRQVNVPTMVVGGLRSFELMEEIIRKGEADFVSLCRPLIREPGVINAWKQGDHRRATCISCNQCLEALRKGESLHCVQNKRDK